MDIALAIICHPADRTVLIAQRPSGVHLPGLWEFPGGKCRAGESPAECAVREAAEEVGLAVSVLEAWPPVTHDYLERRVTLHPFLCRPERPEEARPLSARRIVWVRPADLGRYAFPPANAVLLARLQAS